MAAIAIQEDQSPGTFTGDSIRDLSLLKVIWGDVYQVCHYEEAGYWWAGRRDCVEAVVTADSARELNAALRTDYMAGIVRRFPVLGDCAHVFTTQEVTINGKPVMVRMYVKCGATK